MRVRGTGREGERVRVSQLNWKIRPRSRPRPDSSALVWGDWSIQPTRRGAHAERSSPEALSRWRPGNPARRGDARDSSLPLRLRGLGGRSELALFWDGPLPFSLRQGAGVLSGAQLHSGLVRWRVTLVTKRGLLPLRLQVSDLHRPADRRSDSVLSGGDSWPQIRPKPVWHRTRAHGCVSGYVSCGEGREGNHSNRKAAGRDSLRNSGHSGRFPRVCGS